MLLSCFERHEAGTVHAHLLDVVGLPDSEVQRLETMTREAGHTLDVHAVDPSWLQNLPPATRNGGKVTWVRCVVAELLTELSRVLYLDADTFVVAPLSNLAMSLPLVA